MRHIYHVIIISLRSSFGSFALLIQVVYTSSSYFYVYASCHRLIPSVKCDGAVEWHCRNVRNKICKTEGKNLWYILFKKIYARNVSKNIRSRTCCSLHANLTFASATMRFYCLICVKEHKKL